MRDESKKQSDERTSSRFVRRGNDAVRRKTPDESIGNSAQEHRLEQAGVVEKDDQANVGPRIWRRRTNPGEVGTIKNLAQKLEQKQYAEDGRAAEERHGLERLSNLKFQIS